MSNAQTQAGLSFPPSKSFHSSNGAKEWNYTTAEWKELHDACTRVPYKNRAAIAKAYYTSVPTIQKYAGVAPRPKKPAVSKKIKLHDDLPTQPTAPVIADGKKTLRKPFAPLPYNKNRVLAKLEAELDTKREEVAKLEASLEAISALDVDMIKAILA